MGPCGSTEVLLALMFSTFTNHHFFFLRGLSKYQNMKNCWIRGAFQNRQNFYIWFFLIHHQFWVGTRSGGLKTRVGCFVKTASVLYRLSDEVYYYITSGSHFLKPLPSELNWKRIFLWYPPLEPTRKQVLKSKNRKRTEKQFHVNHRVFRVLTYPETGRFFHSDFFNTQNQSVLRFWSSKVFRTDGYLKNQRIAQPWLKLLVSISKNQTRTSDSIPSVLIPVSCWDSCNDLPFYHCWTVVIHVLVWTSCLMHRCVHVTVHITKLQLQTTFPKPLYISHSACIHWDPGRWKFDVCTACVTHEIATYRWPWEKIGDDKYMLGLLLILISKSWGCPPLGRGMTFVDSNTCAEGRGGYLFLPGFSSLYDIIHGWMTGRTDGCKASRKTTTTSFTIQVWVVKIYVAAVETLRKNERGVKNRMKLNLAPKMEIGQKLELVTHESLCSSQRYGIMIPQKSFIYEMDHR